MRAWMAWIWDSGPMVWRTDCARDWIFLCLDRLLGHSDTRSVTMWWLGFTWSLNVKSRMCLNSCVCHWCHILGSFGVSLMSMFGVEKAMGSGVATVMGARVVAC